MRAKDRVHKLTVTNMAYTNLIGNAQNAGIATINSGTSVVSVSATGVASGDIIQLTPYMYGAARTAPASGQYISLAVMSVRADKFEIVTVGSMGPSANMPVAWSVINR